jgi:hypothetical protein
MVCSIDLIVEFGLFVFGLISERIPSNKDSANFVFPSKWSSKKDFRHPQAGRIILTFMAKAFKNFG